MNPRFKSVVFGTIAVLAIASAAQAQRNSRNGSDRSSRGDDRSMRGSSDPSFNDKYALINQRNIFSRDRRGAGVDRPPPVGVAPQAAYVLTGIVKREDGAGYSAFIEDANSGTTTKIQVGSAIAQGKISQIDFNSLQYAGTGRTVRVAIGMNLDGGVGAQLAGGLASTDSPRSDRGPGGGRDRGGFSGFNRDRGTSGGYGGGPGGPGMGAGGAPLAPTASSTPPAGGITGGSLDDIEAKMRARREAQIGSAQR